MKPVHSLPIHAFRKQPRWMGLGTVRAPDFTDPHYQFSHGGVTEQDPLLNGHIKALQVHPDIGLHAVEGCDLRTCTSSVPAKQGLYVVIVLEGRIDVAFGPAALQLPQHEGGGSGDAGAVGADGMPTGQGAPASQAHGAVVQVCAPERFVRHWRRDKFERKLSLHVHPRLLQSLASTAGYTQWQAVLGQHLWLQHWQPSARAVVLAEQIIHLLSQGNAALLLQSRTLELLHEALQQPLQTAPTAPSALAATLPTPTSPTLQLREHLRMAKLKALLDAQQDGGAPVATLARTVGLSASALQRHFRQIYGASIDEYRRNQRLDHARALLEQTGCSVLEVAHASGYTSAANFATAFKRRFGISPKLVRSKL